MPLLGVSNKGMYYMGIPLLTTSKCSGHQTCQPFFMADTISFYDRRIEMTRRCLQAPQFYPAPPSPPSKPQRVHVAIWYILRAQRGSHIPTLRAKYIPYSYMDPLGSMKPNTLTFRGVEFCTR